MEVWLHSFSFPGAVAERARQAEDWGFTGLLLADSQNLNADIWVELALAGGFPSGGEPNHPGPGWRSMTQARASQASLTS